MAVVKTEASAAAEKLVATTRRCQMGTYNNQLKAAGGDGGGDSNGNSKGNGNGAVADGHIHQSTKSGNRNGGGDRDGDNNSNGNCNGDGAAADGHRQQSTKRGGGNRGGCTLKQRTPTKAIYQSISPLFVASYVDAQIVGATCGVKLDFSKLLGKPAFYS